MKTLAHHLTISLTALKKKYLKCFRLFFKLWSNNRVRSQTFIRFGLWAHKMFMICVVEIWRWIFFSEMNRHDSVYIKGMCSILVEKKHEKESDCEETQHHNTISFCYSTAIFCELFYLYPKIRQWVNYHAKYWLGVALFVQLPRGKCIVRSSNVVSMQNLALIRIHTSARHLSRCPSPW